jgi:hypothetical protein
MTSLVILPTAQTEAANRTRPNRAGWARIEVFAKKLKEQPDANGVIIGGYPDPQGVSLAGYYRQAVLEKHPELEKQLLFVDGRTNNTVDDLRGMAQILRDDYKKPLSSYQVTFCSYPSHYRRIKPALWALGFSHIMLADSGEDPTYPAFSDVVLLALAYLDPLWKGPLGSWARHKANQIAANYWKQLE